MNRVMVLLFAAGLSLTAFADDGAVIFPVSVLTVSDGSPIMYSEGVVNAEAVTSPIFGQVELADAVYQYYGSGFGVPNSAEVENINLIVLQVMSRIGADQQPKVAGAYLSWVLSLSQERVLVVFKSTGGPLLSKEQMNRAAGEMLSDMAYSFRKGGKSSR